MKVKQLISILKQVEDKNKYIHFLGNETNGENEHYDIIFNHLELWDDSEESVTVFMCNN